MAYPADYQVGAHFEALDEGVLVADLKSFEHFFGISSFPGALCLGNLVQMAVSAIVQNMKDVLLPEMPR